jgi:hypothetical protein
MLLQADGGEMDEEGETEGGLASLIVSELTEPWMEEPYIRYVLARALACHPTLSLAH